MKDKNQFNHIEKVIGEEYANIAGIAIMIGGDVRYEHYFNDYKKEDTIHIASATKSVLSILIGIAIDQGYINNVQQKVLDFFPDYKVKRVEKKLQSITIKDIITMTAPYKYKHEPYTKVYSSSDWTKAALDLLGGKGHVGEFKYSTVGSHILSGILRNATSRSLIEFGGENLFTPLEIKLPVSRIIDGKESYLDFIKGKHVSGWVSDKAGVNTGGWGLTLRLEDMLKLGNLYLNKGCIGNKQIVSESWIQESTRVSSSMGELDYGYMWWLISGQESAYAAIGDGGNVIYVCPEKELVVAIASSFKPRAKDRIELIKTHILPNI